MKISRRKFLTRTGTLTTGAAFGGLEAARGAFAGDPTAASLLQVDFPALVSRSDLIYQTPVKRAAEGHPIGNGRMGTMVWTTPTALHFQINRVDVLAVNKNHAGKRDGPADYCGACAQITLEVGGPVFNGNEFEQRLSLHSAEAWVRGNAVRARCFVSAAEDVLVLEIEDARPEPQPLRLALSMWRAPEVKTGEHSASYTFAQSNTGALVTQQFTEGDYYCTSVVAAEVAAPEAQAEVASERSRTVVVPALRGKRLILISSAASWSRKHDVERTASRLLERAAARTYDDLRVPHARWWAGFWSRTFVHLTSKDGLADFMERLRALHLYLMASTSRGVLPPKWNGSLFTTAGDARGWGSQFWVWTTEISYYSVYAAGAADLANPFFAMYVKQLPSCREAAQQRWGVSGGAYILEAGPFDGPVVLPPDVAHEYQDVYLGRKPNTQLSRRARSFGQFECVLTQFADGRKPPQIAAGRYSYVSHIATSGCELAVQAWWRFRYTGDRRWLADYAYPLLRDTVEFYRHLAKKQKDGRYHLNGLNQHEAYWGTNDGLLDIAAVRGAAPLAIRSAELLDIDHELQNQWREFLGNLAPYPMGSDPRTYGAVEHSSIDLWATGYPGDVPYPRYLPVDDFKLWPVFPFENWTLESRNPQMDKIVQTLTDLDEWRRSLTETGTGVFNSSFRTPIIVARTGRATDLPRMLAAYYRGFGPLPNGLCAFEPGPETQGTEILGCVTAALQEALLQSVSSQPGGKEVITVFPAWPAEWEASFRLMARGGFAVTACRRKGRVEFVEIESRLGETCRLRNPWGRPCALEVLQNGAAQELAGEVLEFRTKQGESYRLLPKGAPRPPSRRISPPKTRHPSSFAVKLPNGKVVQAMLGRTKSDS